MVKKFIVALLESTVISGGEVIKGLIEPMFFLSQEFGAVAESVAESPYRFNGAVREEEDQQQSCKRGRPHPSSVHARTVSLLLPFALLCPSKSLTS